MTVTQMNTENCDFHKVDFRKVTIMFVVCFVTAHTVLLYVLFCLIYTYCTLYVLYIPHTVHIVHVPCFPVSDVEVSSSTSVHHTYSHLSKYSLM